MPSVVSAEWVVPVAAPPIRSGAIVIDDGWITEIGTVDELGRGTHYGDAAILPGFVNLHSHLENAAFTGFGDGLRFDEWIRLLTARRRALEFEHLVDMARLGAAASLSSGITTTVDASSSGAAAIACGEAGLRATVHLEVFENDVGEALRQFDEKRGRAETGQTPAIGISPHAPYTTGAAVYSAAADLSLPMSTHLAETADEVSFLVRGEGPLTALAAMCGVESPRQRPVEYLDDLGVLGPQLIAAHCVQVTPDEVNVLAARDVSVAHCPRSNAMLGCGIAPLTDLREAGIRVGIGTDSCASAGSLDMFDELRAAIAFARAREQRADALGAADALALATHGSARALAPHSELGSLVPGARADYFVVDVPAGYEDIVEAIVFGARARSVVATFVGGSCRYERDSFDWTDLHARARDARARALAVDGAA